MNIYQVPRAGLLAALVAASSGAWVSNSWAQFPLGAAGSPATVQAAPPASALAGEEEALKDTDLICVVGSEHILAGDMRVIYESHIEKILDQLTPAQEKMIRERYTRDALKQYVDIKALYLEFFRENAGNTSSPKELKEVRDKISVKARNVFYTEQVPNLLKKYKVNDLRSLEETLRANSMSVKQMERQFIEQVLATQAEMRHVPKEKEIEITPDELMKYYEEHAKDWDRPGKARWRQLTARFDRFPTREAAKAGIETMGNEVLFGGNFEAVARQKSQGFTAEKGGVYDWTTQGALKSTQLDQAIFSIPPRLLSTVIEDDIGFHIIEVLEREDASTLSFEDAQEEIRKEIAKTKIGEMREAYHRKVMERTVIWTRWPEDIPGSRSLSEVLEESPLTLADPSR
ncbi:MAG: peptidylprolyl isomerase [Aureliella sp.]